MSSNTVDTFNSNLIYQMEDRPKLGVSILLAFQNIVTALGGIIAVPLIIGGVAGVGVEDTAFLVSATLLASGITTWIQAVGIGPKKFRVGARIPMIMGTDFTFVSPGIAVIAQMGGGLPAYFGATIMGSFIEMILSRFLKVIMRFFPPVVTGTVVTLIGTTLIPVAIDWAAGGYGAADYGSLRNVGISMGVLLIIVLLNRYAKGIAGSASILIGIAIGYIVCIPLGMVEFSKVGEAAWFELPNIFKYGVDFNPKYVVPFIAAYLVTTIETVGVIKAVGEASERELTNDRIADGILCDGVGSFISGFLGGGPNTSFSQNVGLIPLTRVASSYVAAVAGILLFAIGLLPKFSTLISIMPNPVLGGAGILMFGVVGASGVKTLGKIHMNNRNLIIIAASLGIGLGVAFRPDFVANLPAALSSVFSSGISAGTVVALILNIILKEETPEEEKKEIELEMN